MDAVNLQSTICSLHEATSEAFRLVCGQALTERGVREARGEARVVELLMVPVEAFDLSAVLRVQSFPRLMALLPPDAYRDMAAGLVRSALKRGVEVG